MVQNGASTRKVFVIPKDLRLLKFSQGSLWILGELNSSCVIKKRTIQSEYFDLLSGRWMSSLKPVQAKLSSKMSQNRVKILPSRKVFVIPKDLRLSKLSQGSLWILGELNSSCVLKLSLLRSEYSDLLSGS